MVPWLVWSAFYGIGKTFLEIRSGHPALGWFDSSVLLMGPSVHLWYLPAAFAASIAGHLFLKHVRGELVASASILLALASIALACLPLPERQPLAQWIYITPAVAIALIFAIGEKWDRVRFGQAIVLVVGIALFVFASFGFGGAALPLGALIAFGALALKHQGRVWRDLNPVCFFVFLVHPAMAVVIQQISGSTVRSDWLAAWTTVLSFLLSIVIVRIPKAKKYLL
jgi:hypothetical protein